MISFKDSGQLLAALNSLEGQRRVIDGYVRTQSSVSFFCAVCDALRTGSIDQPKGIEWIDLRDQVRCLTCGHNSRARLLFDVLSQAADLSPGNSAHALLFERVTPVYALLDEKIADLTGVEFGGSHLAPGEPFESHGFHVRNEDMQNLSFEDERFDIVIHSDVLEHVPDPMRGMGEVHRVLRPGGKCVFACPVYTVMEHRQRAYLDALGELVFTGEPAYHGDPLREAGVPVFYEFGLSLLDDLKELGFAVDAVLYHSIARGYFSNDNPYTVGLMWPLVFVCTKQAPCTTEWIEAAASNLAA